MVKTNATATTPPSRQTEEYTMSSSSPSWAANRRMALKHSDDVEKGREEDEEETEDEGDG